MAVGNVNKQNRKTIFNMETYHPHKLPPGAKIKELIFEFLMMFLAITGGFFMENMREEYVERHKEKEYIESMVNDIKQDTISVQEIITTCEKQMRTTRTQCWMVV